ncbi:aquaporin SIP1-1-like [Syzygium oleosum]|uniref:aquaporin SIP1-1-like n=1 Tax=Syzygium oleosum TaxID=219896 RepID=UPI0024B89FF0|nr:aquaporin SIP1-1-like [Syzygium oleosum]
MGLLRSAAGDAVLTCLWVTSVSTVGTLTYLAATALSVPPQSAAGLLLTTALVAALVLLFSVLGALLGGASFNPATTVAFRAAGLRPDASLLSMAARFPAQAAGGVAGANAILRLMPAAYRHMLRGPSLKVDLHTGAAAEGALTFAISLAALVIFVKGPRSLLVKVWLLAMATVGLVVVGSSYTGPAMNPANAFGWAYVNDRHNTWDQFYVYWICPFVGAVFAGWAFKLLFPVQKPKEKKA